MNNLSRGLGLKHQFLYDEVDLSTIYFLDSHNNWNCFNYSDIKKYQGENKTLNYRSDDIKHNIENPFQLNQYLSSNVTGSSNEITNIYSLDIHNKKVQRLGDYSFVNCSKLSSVNIPYIKSLGQYCFWRDNKITSIKCQKIEYLDVAALRGCKKLSTIYIPNIKKIMSGSLREITSLSSIQLFNVEHIDTYAFNNDSKLSVIDFSYRTIKTIPSLRNISTFVGIYSKYKIIVPNSLYKNWILSGDWMDISSHISSVTQPIVSFLSGDTYDTLVKSEKLNYGMSAIVPSVIPSKEGYEFIGWQNNYNDVTSDTSCYAIWGNYYNSELI